MRRLLINSEMHTGQPKMSPHDSILIFGNGNEHEVGRCFCENMVIRWSSSRFGVFPNYIDYFKVGVHASSSALMPVSMHFIHQSNYYPKFPMIKSITTHLTPCGKEIVLKFWGCCNTLWPKTCYGNVLIHLFFLLIGLNEEGGVVYAAAAMTRR